MKGNKPPPYLLIGQGNLHKNAECAAALANHIYYQMRELDVLSPGNYYDRCQHLVNNPRREGLPKTVTEWRAMREERRAKRREERIRTNNAELRSESEGEELSAFEIANLETQETPSPPTRRSARIRGKQISKSSRGKVGRATQGLGSTTPSGGSSAHSHSMPTLTLHTDPRCAAGTDGKNPPAPATLPRAEVDLNFARPKGNKRGSPPEAFIYALQEPPVVNKRIVNIKNAIQIMDTKCSERKKNPVKPRAAIICSNHLNMWPIPEHCSRDMAVGLLKGTNLGDMYVVSLYCDGEKGKRAVPEVFRRFRKIAKTEKIPVLMLMDSNSHSEVLWSSKSTNKRGKEWESFLSNDQSLVVINTGDHFTYMSKQGQTIIDVTVASPIVAEKISQWRVVDSIANSDHLSIEMLLQLDKGWTNPARTWDLSSKKFDRNGFTAIMERLSSETVYGNLWGPRDLDKNGQSIVDDMTEALDETAPLTTRSTNIARAGWFDNECKRLLKRCRQIRQYIRNWERKRRRRGLPEYPNFQKYTWQDYIKCRKAFRKRCRRVKRKHWRRFIAGISDTEVIAKVSKKLDKSANAELGCFKHPSGVRCTPAETVQQLKDAHFPKSLNNPTDKEREFMLNGLADINDTKADFISVLSVKVCISAFKSHKAPGPDKLKMLPFKLLGPKALKRLTDLYKASYLLGAMPECFKLIEIIFIPKADKPSYDVPKAHRPISLMNNIMKIPEKLFLWRQEDTNLVLNPLEGEQHGFMKCRSCDSAITVVVSYIEHALIRDWYGVVAFLDFQGAYDALQYTSMIAALWELDTDPHIISWYKDFFYHRRSRLQIKGVETMIYHTQGAPQGGIGSPFLWAAVLNELIKIIKELDEVKIVAYADDLCLIATGPDKDHCTNVLQGAVDAVMEWAGEHLLALSPTKSETILFTKKRNYPKIVDSATRIKINGHPLEYVRGSVRYLGVWLDRNLNWNEHIKIKATKVQGLLHKLAGVSGDLWGYKPLIGKYCWEGLARPILSFGCLGWIPAALKKKTTDTQLTKVQRLGYKLMAFFRRSTPNKGLDVLFNNMPIKYHLLKTAAGSYMRTVQVAPFSGEEMQTSIPARKSHRTWIEEFLQDFDLDYLREPLDAVTLHRKWDKVFQVDMSSMNLSKASAGTPRFLADVDAYTDGSRTEDPDPSKTIVGAGFVLMKGKKMLISNQRWAASEYKLKSNNSNFQAEVYAIKKLCQTVLSHTDEFPECWVSRNESMDIYCDSQSAVLALNTIFVHSALVGETIDLLNELAQKVKSLTLRWIRGHQGHIGNSRADTMARKGRDSLGPPAPDAPRMAKTTMNLEISRATNKLWRMMWNMDPSCRQTKDWCPHGPRPGFAFEILHLPRPICSQVIHFVTGHNFLRRHEALFESEELSRLEQKAGLGDDEEFHEAMEPIATCSLCGKDEESFHIMTECPILTTARIGVFGKAEVLPPYDNIPVYKLVS